MTATVTKPAWMQVPDADAYAYRRHSLTSNGSTASLTSVLDHDSYISEPETDDDVEKLDLDEQKPLYGGEGDAKVKEDAITKQVRKVKRQAEVGQSRENGAYDLKRSHSSDSGLSAWELWLILKVKEERQQRKAAEQQRKNEKQERLLKEREKQVKLQKAEEMRQEWVKHKNSEEKLSKKMQKLKLESERRLKQEEEQRIQERAQEKFADWAKSKSGEERERKQKERAKKQKEEEMRMARQAQAEARFQEWLKKNKARPKSAPQKKVTGYYPNMAYPKPSYVNPIPWHPPAIPKEKKEKPKKARPKKYVWNPDKYY